MKTMLGAVVISTHDGKRQLELQEVPVPEIENRDDVLLKVEACGICGEAIRSHGHKWIGNLLVKLYTIAAPA